MNAISNTSFQIARDLILQDLAELNPRKTSKEIATLQSTYCKNCGKNHMDNIGKEACVLCGAIK